MIVLVVLAVLMAGAWIAQQRTGVSGRVGTPRKMLIFLQNQGFGALPLSRRKGMVT
jgi:hypothetical protein